MEDLFAQFNRHSDVRMTDDERSAMRSRLRSLAEATPIVRAAPASRATAPGAKRAFFGAFGAPKAVPALGLMAAMLFTGGGVYAAEGALPGDVLYPVKTNIIENVRSAVTVTAEAKAKWESERATRRLEEVEHLAAAGELDEAKAAELEAKFEVHASRVTAQLEEMRGKGEDIVVAAARHGSSLRAHEHVLAQLGAGNQRLFAGLTAAVRAEADATEADIAADQSSPATEATMESGDDVAATADGDVSGSDAVAPTDESDESDESTEATNAVRASSRTEAAALGVRGAASQKIAQLGKLVDKWRTRIDEGMMTDMTDALDAAKTAFAEGDASLSAGDYASAFTSFRLAHRKAEEARGFGIVDLRAAPGHHGSRVAPAAQEDASQGTDVESGDGAGNARVEVRGWDPKRKDPVVGGSSATTVAPPDDGTGEHGDDADLKADVDVSADAGLLDSRSETEGDGAFRFRFGR